MPIYGKAAVENKQADEDKQIITGRTGMQEQVCQDKNAETGRPG
jgi:hypothetical protein